MKPSISEWEWGREWGEGLQLFQMLCCCEYFSYCACLKFSLYRWQNEMCHLIISPTCTAGNLSSKQSAVTIWFTEYQRLSENWAEKKEEKRIEHFSFCKFLFFIPTKIAFPLKSRDQPKGLRNELIHRKAVGLAFTTFLYLWICCIGLSGILNKLLQ